MYFQVNTVAQGLQSWQRAHWLTTATNSNRNGSPYFTLYAKFKNWTLFSVASVLEVKINSIVFRLARHLWSSTSLVYIYIYIANSLKSQLRWITILLLILEKFLFLIMYFLYLFLKIASGIKVPNFVWVFLGINNENDTKILHTGKPKKKELHHNENFSISYKIEKIANKS